MANENNKTEQMMATSSVNINTATAEVLALELTGVGEKRAQAIVDYRSENGPFKSVQQLQDIKGIGEATVEKNADKIKL